MDNGENFSKFVQLQLGVTALEIELDNRAEAQHATELMAAQAQNSIEIFSRDLDPALYERESFLEALSALCRRNRQAHIRFLVQEPVDAARHSPRLVELARKLSSSFKVRQPHPDYRHYNEAFLIADGCGLIQRGLADRYEGSANFYAPIEAQRKRDFFTEVWDRSEEHPEFRRLYL